MTTKEKNNLNDRQLIREISIKYMLNQYGYEQAINSINAILQKNRDISELALKTIKEIEKITKG